MFISDILLLARPREPRLTGLFSLQVRHRHTGASGRRELHDRVFKRGNFSEEDADCRLAQEVLSADRQEVSLSLHNLGNKVFFFTRERKIGPSV